MDKAEAHLIVLIEETKPGVWLVTETLEDVHTGEIYHQGQSMVKAETHQAVLKAYQRTMERDFPDAEYREQVSYAPAQSRAMN